MIIFCTIVEAVKQGRNIFDNIKKSYSFFNCNKCWRNSNYFCRIIVRLKIAITCNQLLWINLVTDSLPAIALGLEPPEKNIMSKKTKRS